MVERHYGIRREVTRHAARPRNGIAMGLRALTMVAVLVAMALAVASTASAHPQRSEGRSAGTPGWIVFTAHSPGAGAEQLFRIKPSGNGLKQLTRGTFAAQAPAFSPDGKRIAFVRVGVGIFSMNVDGSRVRALTTNNRDGFPAWSPDGKQIAFTRALGTGFAVMVMSASGAGERQLRQAPPAGRPSWTSLGLLVPTNGDLAKIDPRTGKVLKLYGALIDASVGMDATSVSPDLSTVTFMGPRALDPRDTGCGEGVPCPTFALYIQNLRAHKDPRMLVRDGGPASFSPDGKSLAYVFHDRLVLRVLATGASKAIKTGKNSPTTSTPPVWQP